MYRKFGGNLIKTIDTNIYGRQNFAIGQYFFYYYKIKENEIFSFDELNSFSVYLLNLESKAVLYLRALDKNIDVGDLVQVENSSILLKATGGYAELLVAGVLEPCFKSIRIELVCYRDLKYVSKPWGHELWINGEHPGYAVKRIYIRSGNKTSLQYHRFKHETNVLFQGRAKIHYKKNDIANNDNVKAKDISNLKISPVSIIDISPNILHRIEALDDITLYEVSTPNLDDVIRVSDDTQRANGRIEAEHRSRV